MNSDIMGLLLYVHICMYIYIYMNDILYIIIDDLGMNQHLRLRTRKLYFVPSQGFLAMSFFEGDTILGRLIAFSCGIPVPKCWKIATVAWCSMALNGEIVRVVVRVFFLLHIMYTIYADMLILKRLGENHATWQTKSSLECKSNTGTDHTRFRST